MDFLFLDNKYFSRALLYSIMPQSRYWGCLQHGDLPAIAELLWRELQHYSQKYVVLACCWGKEIR